jgi:hypothetical protein
MVNIAQFCIVEKGESYFFVSFYVIFLELFYKRRTNRFKCWFTVLSIQLKDEFNHVNRFYTDLFLKERMTPPHTPSLKMSKHVACFSNLLNRCFCLQFKT